MGRRQPRSDERTIHVAEPRRRGDLARTQEKRTDQTIPQRRRVGRPRLSHRRHTSRNERRALERQLIPQGVRRHGRHRRHHPTGSKSARREERNRLLQKSGYKAARRGGKHVRLRLSELHTYESNLQGHHGRREKVSKGHGHPLSRCSTARSEDRNGLRLWREFCRHLPRKSGWRCYTKSCSKDWYRSGN